MTNFRMQRIQSAILEEIGRLLVQEEISDPRVSSMVLEREVSVSKDLQHAKVRISGYMSQRKLSKTVEGLNHAAGFIQSKLAARLKMKSTPRLEFLPDHSIEQGLEITEKLREIRSDDESEVEEQQGRHAEPGAVDGGSGDTGIRRDSTTEG